MTKRLISLMLAVLMLALALVSCGDDGDAIDNTVSEASRYTSTINLWVITEDKMVQKASDLLFAGKDPDKYPEDPNKQNDEQKAFLASLEEGLEKAWRQLDDIQDQLNVLTKKRFKTKVNIRYFTEDVYYTKLESAFGDLAAAKKNGTLVYPTVGEETEKNEHGVPELKYPAALEYQADVVFLGGSQNYYTYLNNGWLAPISSEDISNYAAQLNYHLSAALLAAPQYNGNAYAIPNNNALGEYTYLAVDAALAERYAMSLDAMENSLYSNETKQFLDYVYNSGESIYPIYSETGTVDLEMMHYWSFASNGSGAYTQTPNVFSLFGGFYNAGTTPADSLPCRNVLTMQSYTDALEKKVYYENTAGYITQDANARSAVRVVKGGYAEKAELESMGYTVLATMAPRIADEDVFGSMFAVGAYTRDTTRALEIISMLNTEAEVRNLLQYGIEGVNYTLKSVVGADGKERVYAEMKADNTYVMDLAKTGNMFVAYPNAEHTDLANGKYGVYEWDNAKKQNLDATLYPTLGLHFSTEYVVDEKSVRILNAVSAKFKTVVLDALTTVADVQAMKEAVTTNGASNAGMAAWLLEVTGGVTYVPVGQSAAVAVTVDDLSAALAGMASTYRDNIAPGSKLSVKVLYEEWWLRTNAADEY